MKEGDCAVQQAKEKIQSPSLFKNCAGWLIFSPARCSGRSPSLTPKRNKECHILLLPCFLNAAHGHTVKQGKSFLSTLLSWNLAPVAVNPLVNLFQTSTVSKTENTEQNIPTMRVRKRYRVVLKSLLNFNILLMFFADYFSSFVWVLFKNDTWRLLQKTFLGVDHWIF